MSRTGSATPRTGRSRGLPGVRSWGPPLAVWAASRLWSSALLLAMFHTANAAGWPFASRRSHPTFFTFSGSWDGWFYRSIAEHGYPAVLPTDGRGHVLPNPWAFLPVFPALERGLTAITGLTTYTAGTLIALAAGAGAAVALHRLLAPQVGDRRATAAVALLCFGPTGFLLQVAYAESLFLLLVLGALLALRRSAWTAFAVLGAAAALTRPGGIALLVALALQLVSERRSTGRFPPLLAPGVAAAVVAAASLCWPLIAGSVTGVRGAYLETELSWWTGWVGRPAFVPFTPWLLITWRWGGAVGVLLALGVIVAVAVWVVHGSPRRLDPATIGFSGGYLAYLLAVFLPQVSLPRLLLPAAPLLGADAFTGTRRRARAWLLTGAALQPVAVVLLWFVGYP